jgi:formyl-CoA transferase
MFPEMDHPVAGKVKVTNNPLKFGHKQAFPRTPAPTLGQDNEEVYGKFLGKDEAAIKTLKENGVI